jgi:beta-1,4-N-acetylglucosaminyltransferase
VGILYDDMETPKIGIITSRGGHLFQMYRLKPWWEKYDHFWVTLPGEDVSSLLNKERIYYGCYPESRNIGNAVKNFFLARRILLSERPTMLISCGAGIAPPFFYVGKLLGISLVFIETYDYIVYPTISGKLIQPIVDYMLIQNVPQKKFYKKAIFRGATL